MNSNLYFFMICLALDLRINGVSSLSCMIGGADECTNWSCNESSSVSSGVCPLTDSGCAAQYKIAESSPKLYTVETFCASDTDKQDRETTCTFDDSSTGSTCVQYCNSDNNCNDIYASAQVSPSQTAIECIQCRSHNSVSGSCHAMNPLPRQTQTCPRNTHQYCTTSHIVVLGREGQVEQEIVVRGCSESDFDDGCSVDTIQIGVNNDTRAVAVTCIKTCGVSGCNNEPLPFSGLSGSGRKCLSCLSTNGACTSFKSVTCLSDEDLCFSKVIYTEGFPYMENTDFSSSVHILFEERKCASTAVSSNCTTTNQNIANSNLRTVSCEETCQDDNCNAHWPNRPRCSQCSGSYYSQTGELITDSDPSHYTWCKENPPMPSQCADPSYKFCYVSEKFRAGSDNAVKWGYPKTFERGCLKEESWSRCKEYTFQDERVALHCQFTCSEHDCNLGSDAIKLTISTSAFLVSILFSENFWSGL